MKYLMIDENVSVYKIHQHKSRFKKEFFQPPAGSPY